MARSATTKNKLAMTLEQTRLRRGMLQTDVAKKIGIAVEDLVQIETGAASPSFALLVKLSSVLTTPTSQLLREAGILEGGDDEKLIYHLAKFLEQAPTPERMRVLLTSLQPEPKRRVHATKVSRKRK